MGHSLPSGEPTPPSGLAAAAVPDNSQPAQCGLYDPSTSTFHLLIDGRAESFAYGMPPHGGWGLGVERLVQKMLNLPNVRETIIFPRDRNRLTP